MLVADRAIVPFEGDHPRGGRRKRGPRGGRRRRRSWGEVGARRAGRSASRNLLMGARPTRPSLPRRIRLLQRRAPRVRRACTRGRPSATAATCLGEEDRPGPPRARVANSDRLQKLPPLAEDVTSLIARDAPIKRTKKHRAPRYERYTTATSAQEYLRMGGAAEGPEIRHRLWFSSRSRTADRE